VWLKPGDRVRETRGSVSRQMSQPWEPVSTTRGLSLTLREHAYIALSRVPSTVPSVHDAPSSFLITVVNTKVVLSHFVHKQEPLTLDSE
jgi:hypothetical protein